MSGRISLKACATRIAAIINDPSVLVSTKDDPEIQNKLPKTFPAVWVMAQRSTPIDDGRGFSGVKRQKYRTEVSCRLIVRKIQDPPVPGDDVEARVTELYQKVEAAMFGWKFAGIYEDFSCGASSDGPSYESVVAVDITFVCTTTNTRGST